MKRRRREIVVGLLSVAPGAAVALLAVGLNRIFVDLGDQRFHSYYALFGIRVGPADWVWETIGTLAPPAAALLGLLPLHLASRGAVATDAELRRRVAVRLAAVLTCGLILIADAHGLLIFYPSGRGATRAEFAGTVLTQLVAPALGVLFLWGAVGDWLSLGRRARRRRAGSCPGCGYDLRATPERCPECGAECGAAAAPS